MNIRRMSFCDAYHNMLDNVINKPEFITSPRGLKIKEILNAKIEITCPHYNLFKNPVRSVPKQYLANELLLYFSGRKDAQSFEKASSFWGQIKNDDDTINSAYGNLLFTEMNENGWTEWGWAVNSLEKDKDSRQAIMHYNKPQHMVGGVKDFPCTVVSQFFIRNNNLYLTTYMRSNDIFFGVTFDFPFFLLLMQCMWLQLRDIYPNLNLGSYTHIAGSLHAYEKDFEILEQMLDEDFEEDMMPALAVNPILHYDIQNIMNGCELRTNDSFFKWLQANK